MSTQLTQPINLLTTTQYDVTALNIYLVDDTISVVVDLKDSLGKVVQTTSQSISISSLPLGPGVLNGIRNAVIQSLKQKGLIN